MGLPDKRRFGTVGQHAAVGRFPSFGRGGTPPEGWPLVRAGNGERTGRATPVSPVGGGWSDGTPRAAVRDVLLQNLADGEVRLHLGDFDLHALANLAAGDDDDVTALDAGDAVALLAEVLYLDVPYLALLNGRL